MILPKLAPPRTSFRTFSDLFSPTGLHAHAVFGTRFQLTSVAFFPPVHHPALSCAHLPWSPVLLRVRLRPLLPVLLLLPHIILLLPANLSTVRARPRVNKDSALAEPVTLAARFVFLLAVPSIPSLTSFVTEKDQMRQRRTYPLLQLRKKTEC